MIVLKVVHFDESGLTCEGKIHGPHVTCNSMWTYFFVHTYRGAKALDTYASLIRDFKNWPIA